MRTNLETAPSKEEKSRPGKTGTIQQNTTDVLPRVVIVGASFGGLQATWALHKASVQVTVIDRSHHQVCQPRLYQVAMADLFPANISAPIRSILKKHRYIAGTLAEMTSMTREGQPVPMHDHSVSYDYLIVARGARYSYFGHDAWGPCAPGLNSIDDAVLILRKILLAFESAERAKDHVQRQALLTLVLL
ncbi:MAG TPA: FAD-dependent oxidoreductase [Ktedonosporobacter sp.]|nr:FAD-dependent oxidoreductase [Ktedonosporobacter sp.]